MRLSILLGGGFAERSRIGDTVVVLGRVGGDVAVEKVAADGGGIALGGWAEAAGARHDHVDDGAGWREEGAFAWQVAGGTIRRGERDDGGCAGLAAEQAERGRGHAFHAQGAGGIRILQQAPDATGAAAAAIAARAAR